MTKIAINLLPEEFTSQRIKDTKFYKTQAIGVGMILVLIFFSSLTIALRVLQYQRIKQAEQRLGTAQQRVLTFKDKQVALMALKNRLTAINQYVGVSSPQAELLKIVNSLLPPSVTVNSLLIGRSGDISISAIIPESTTLDSVLKDLLNKDKNKNKITKVSVESLNKSRDGVYRINFRISSR